MRRRGDDFCVGRLRRHKGGVCSRAKPGRGRPRREIKPSVNSGRMQEAPCGSLAARGRAKAPRQYRIPRACQQNYASEVNRGQHED